jgi:hypothetical protein
MTFLNKMTKFPARCKIISCEDILLNMTFSSTGKTFQEVTLIGADEAHACQ